MAGLIFSRGFEQRVDFLAHPTKTADAFGYAVDVEGPTEKYPFIGRTSEYTDRHNRIRLVVHNQNEKFVVATLGCTLCRWRRGQPLWFGRLSTGRLSTISILLLTSSLSKEASPLHSSRVNKHGSTQSLCSLMALRTEGELGTVGVKFIADITITDENGPRKFSPYFQFMGPGEAERPNIGER
ncbi:MAG: hypothetical protein R2688_10400 [Fimbriimonadaceae bacterium]